MVSKKLIKLDKHLYPKKATLSCHMRFEHFPMDVQVQD